MDSNSRKRLRRSKEGEDPEVQEQQQHGTTADDRLFETTFPKHLEAKFATAIFEIGLKHSSPKILMPLMPTYTNLSTEHIKSHLQKYRIHRQRSKDEFMEFYNAFMKESYQKWEDNKGWKQQGSDNSLQGYYGGSGDSQSSSREHSSANFQASYDAGQYASMHYPVSYLEHAHSGDADHGVMAQFLRSNGHSGSEAGSASDLSIYQHPLGGDCAHAAAMAARNEAATSAYAAQIYRETEALLQSALELGAEAAAGEKGRNREISAR